MYSILSFDTKKLAPKNMAARGFLGWGGGGCGEGSLIRKWFFLGDKILPNYDLNNWKGIFFHKFFYYYTKISRILFGGKHSPHFNQGFYLLNFFWPILCYSHTGDHSQEDLAKFDYKSVQKEKKHVIVWQPAASYCPKLAISKKKILYDDFGIFFSQKPFVWCALDFFWQKFTPPPPGTKKIFK